MIYLHWFSTRPSSQTSSRVPDGFLVPGGLPASILRDVAVGQGEETAKLLILQRIQWGAMPDKAVSHHGNAVPAEHQGLMCDIMCPDLGEYLCPKADVRLRKGSLDMAPEPRFDGRRDASLT